MVMKQTSRRTERDLPTDGHARRLRIVCNSDQVKRFVAVLAFKRGISYKSSRDQSGKRVRGYAGE